MHAIIMAGGKGTRLRPYTTVLPKPMMPIGEYPILEVVVRQLEKFGFNRVTMCVNHQADIIKAYFKTGESLGIKIDYVLEEIPLGTMGALKLISNLPDNFLIMNGDVLTDLNFGDFLIQHDRKSSYFSIASALREQKINYGVLEIEGKKLVGMIEKPVNKYRVSMGVYCASKEVVSHIPKGCNFGFDDLMHALLKNKKNVSIYDHDGYWLDIGRPDDYMQAIEDYDKQDVWKFT